MLMQTTRFGMVEIDELRIITFVEPLLGFPRQRRFALIETAQDGAFYWLQSIEDPGLAFVVCDPQVFAPDYRVHLRPEEAALLGVRDESEPQVLAIVNRVDDTLTANLLGPVVVGPQTLYAKQVVLSDKRWSTRHPLMQMTKPAAIAKTA